MFEIVARSGTVKLRDPAPKNSTNLPTTLARRSISVTCSTRSVAVTPGTQRADHVHADHVRREKIDRLPEHRRLGFDAADAPADHAETRRSCRCANRVPTNVSGKHDAVLEEHARARGIRD